MIEREQAAAPPPTGSFEQYGGRRVRGAMIVNKFAATLVLVLAAGGCGAVVENRVEARLAEAGVPAGMAACMAEIWAEDLSVGQIRGISRFATRLSAERQTLTIPRLIGHVREWNDPGALGVVTSSAARCALS